MRYITLILFFHLTLGVVAQDEFGGLENDSATTINSGQKQGSNEDQTSSTGDTSSNHSKQSDNKHSVKSGQYLSLIAKEHYRPITNRAPLLWPLIYVASDLKSTALRVKQELVIPDLQPSKEAQQQTILSVALEALKRAETSGIKNPEELVDFLQGDYSKMVQSVYPDFFKTFEESLQKFLNGQAEEWAKEQIQNIFPEINKAEELEDLVFLSDKLVALEEQLGQIDGVKTQIEKANQEIARKFDLQFKKIQSGIREDLAKGIEAKKHLDELEQNTESEDLQALRDARKTVRVSRFKMYMKVDEFQQLSKNPTLKSRADELVSFVKEERVKLGIPEPKIHPYIIQVNRGQGRKHSLTIFNRNFKDWLNVSELVLKKKTNHFPEVTNRYNVKVNHRDIIKAIIIQESSGVHKEANGSIRKNRNMSGTRVISTDWGFGQINDRAHRNMTINVFKTSELIASEDYPYAQLVRPNFYNTSKTAGRKDNKADFHNPMQNLHSISSVLSYCLNKSKSYRNTADEPERLVKALSGYNHGPNSRDYHKTWDDFVQEVADGSSHQGKISGVHYGIKMKLYLGLDLTPVERSYYMKKKRRGTLSSFYYFEVEPSYSFAHFDEDAKL